MKDRSGSRVERVLAILAFEQFIDDVRINLLHEARPAFRTGWIGVPSYFTDQVVCRPSVNDWGLAYNPALGRSFCHFVRSVGYSGQEEAPQYCQKLWQKKT